MRAGRPSRRDRASEAEEEPVAGGARRRRSPLGGYERIGSFTRFGGVGSERDGPYRAETPLARHDGRVRSPSGRRCSSGGDGAAQGRRRGTAARRSGDEGGGGEEAENSESGHGAMRGGGGRHGRGPARAADAGGDGADPAGQDAHERLRGRAVGVYAQHRGRGPARVQPHRHAHHEGLGRHRKSGSSAVGPRCL